MFDLAGVFVNGYVLRSGCCSIVCVISLSMDRLPLERKSSTERMRVKLMQKGFDEDKVMAMDQPKLRYRSMTTFVAKGQRLVRRSVK